jgi:hypothetical protein
MSIAFQRDKQPGHFVLRVEAPYWLWAQANASGGGNA